MLELCKTVLPSRVCYAQWLCRPLGRIPTYSFIWAQSLPILLNRPKGEYHNNVVIAAQPVPGKHEWNRLYMAQSRGALRKKAASNMYVSIKSVQERKIHNDRNRLHSRHHSNSFSQISKILKRTRSGCLSPPHTRAQWTRVSTPVKGQNSCFSINFVASRYWESDHSDYWALLIGRFYF